MSTHSESSLDASDIAPPRTDGSCMSCGTPHARNWHTRDGVARLCPPCATLHGLGCP